MISHERQEVVRAVILAGRAAGLLCPDELTSRERFQVCGQKSTFGRVPITSGVHPTPDMSLHRYN